jgi:uncharacterized protein (DUF885 family)
MENYARMCGNDDRCRREVCMKKTVTALTALAVLLFTAGSLMAQNGEDAKFKKFQDNLWDTYFKFFPTAGTMQGYTKYDDKLEDLSSGSIEKFLDSLDGFNQELVSKIDKFKLSPDLQLEHELSRDFLDLHVLKLENSLFILDNPLFYNDLFVNSIRSLVTRNPNAPAAVSRARLLPGLIKKAKDNLKTPPREYTEAAIKQLPGVIDFYKTELPKLAGSSSALLAEAQKILLALDDYQRFLQGELLSRSTGNFRNPEAHRKLIRFLSQGNLSIEQDIVGRSQADTNNIRREMFLVCIPFYKIMYPDQDIEQLARTKGEEATRMQVIQGVFDKIKGDHVSREEFPARIAQAAAGIKDFLQQAKALDLPDEDLAVEPMPSYLSGTEWYDLAGPGAFEQTGPYTLYVRPIPADWSADEATSFLEEHNNYFIDYLAIQRAYPGTFVPIYFTRKDPSVVKRMTANRALFMGWPLCVENMLVFDGYKNYDLRSRLSELKLLLKTVIDFQMDMNVHEGTYNKEQVVNYMMRGGFMTQAEAERHWDFIVLNPGEASLPYIGYQEILDMEKDYSKLKGSAFSKRDFLQKILSYGAIPFRTIKTKIAQ